MTRVSAIILGLVLFITAGEAGARVVTIPEGGKAVAVVREGVVCGPLPEGWAAEDRQSVRPPAADAPGPRTIDVKVAPNNDGCEKSKDVVTVMATGPLADIDPGSVIFAADEGRLELRGQRLKGLQVLWEAGEKVGKETCLDPTPMGPGGKFQQCVVPLQAGLPITARLRWLPTNAVFGEEVRFHDASGAGLSPERFELRPARILVNQVVPAAATVDVSVGPGRVPLVHPTAVAAVDCGLARCELGEGGVVVRSVPAPATSVSIRLRLNARVFYARGESQDSQLTVTLPLVQCTLSVASGPPLRDAEDTVLVVRVDSRCAKDANRGRRWSVNGEVAEELRLHVAKDAAFVVLRVGRLISDRVTITAHRADLDGTLIGSISAKTMPAPRPRVTLELPKHGKVEFIPTNREATLTVAGAGERARLVPLPVEGAYSVRPHKGNFLVRGDENAGGFVALRFAYRVEGLPPELGNVDVAVLSERVQRAVREASVPAPFGASAEGAAPLVELVCNNDKGEPQRVPPGKLYKLPFEARDSCKVLVHHDRLKPEYGTQEIVLEVEVTRAEGGRRGEASFSRGMILVPGGEARVIPLRGGTDEFDRILVRVAHVLDETRYALSATNRQPLPAVQWSLLNEGGRIRLYASAAIPAGLYRVTKPTGQLTLNFGVLSRLTWLDERGKEGLLGAEVGLMGMGLIQRPGAIEYPLTIGAVTGLGIRVPLGSGAAVGVHIWGVYEFRESFEYKHMPKEKGECGDAMPRATSCRNASKFALIFGPSISIGNVGTNL